MPFATTDLSDAHPEAQVCDPEFGDFGGNLAFHGDIKTLKVFEDNALVRATLETPGEGHAEGTSQEAERGQGAETESRHGEG